MRKLILLVCVIMLLTSCTEQTNHTTTVNAMNIDTTTFNALHLRYKEVALQHRRFKHKDIDSLIQQHKGEQILQVEQIGASFEQRAIYELRYGEGGKTVMLWSQMHGDEPTATMALFDLFNFLEGSADGYDSIRALLKEQLSIHFIPMLNPDGAERYSRRTAQSIDMNRDARAGQTVEGALLRTRAKQLQPRYAFNLHDQNIYYNVPDTKNPVTISLLAPAYNAEREVNVVRDGAMQLAVGMNDLLQQYIPDAVAKYDDTHTARGFGDNFQAWGASTVLIESGGLKGDPEKQEIRKLNFCIILKALIEIAEGSYMNHDSKKYEDIPFNASQLHDVVLRNVSLTRDTITYQTDIAIRRPETTVGRDYYVKGYVEDVGDLEDSYGYDELDATGLHLVIAEQAKKAIPEVTSISFADAVAMLRKGIMAVPVYPTARGELPILHQYPIHFYSKQQFYPTTAIELGGTANFFLADDTGELKYAIFNGYLINLEQPADYRNFKNRIL